MRPGIISRPTSIVLRCDVIRKIVVKDKSQQPIEECQIDLLVHLREYSLHENIAFSLACLPDVCQVVDTLTPLVDEEGWRLGVGRLDPGWEQATFIRLEEQELIKIRVRDLFYWLDVIARNELVVGIEELDARFLECTLSE